MSSGDLYSQPSLARSPHISTPLKFKPVEMATNWSEVGVAKNLSAFQWPT